MDSVKVGKSTYHAPTGMYYTRDSKGGTSATRGKENAEIQLAGMEKQRIEELKKVNISEPNYFKDTSKEIYSADIGYGTQSFSPEAYNKEIERIQRDSPRTSILDTTTGDLTSGIISPIKLSGTDFYSRTKVQVYTDPKTGEVIEDIGIYLKEKNIPYSTNKKKVDLFKPSGQLTYDTEGLKIKKHIREVLVL